MDKGLRGIIAGGQAAVIVVKSTDMVEEARRVHDLWPVATAALGRALTAGAMMGTAIKDINGRVTLSLRGNGPLGAVVVAAKPDGTVKGYVDQPHVDLPLKDNGKLDVGGAVGGEGRIMVIRSQQTGEPYVGQCPLINGEVAEDIAYYYVLSEQKPTLLALGVRLAAEGQVLSAGGVMVQPLPGCEDALITELEDSAWFMDGIAGLIEQLEDAQSVFDFLFSRWDGRILEAFEPRFHCDCSRERMEEALISLGEADLKSLAEDGKAELVCHFCNAAYHFDGQQLKALYRSAGGSI